MQLQDLLLVLHDDFAAQVPTVDAAMRRWIAQPAHPREAHTELQQCWQRSAEAAGMVGMQGFAAFLAQVESFAAERYAQREHVNSSELYWLAQWHESALQYLAAPASEAAVQAVLGYLRSAPQATDGQALDALGELLRQPPALPHDGMDDELGELPPAEPTDVILTAEDLDADLFGTFLQDAPSQIERLAEYGRALAEARIDHPGLLEAQRIAHTFKGSGNIIGLPCIGRMAHRVEDILDHAVERMAEGEQIPPLMARDTLGAIECLAQVVGHLNGEDAAPGHRLAVLQRLLDWVNQLRLGDAYEWQPEPVAIAVEEAADVPGSEGADAVAGGAPALAIASDQLRVGGERLNRLMRRAGQSLIYADRYNQFARSAIDRLQRLEINHQNLVARLRELELSVEKQSVTLLEKQEAGEQFDPLEMDRYDALHTATRFVAESAQDELELARQARAETERMLAMLREQNNALRDQHRELIDARLVPVKTILPRLKRNVAQTAAATQKLARLEVTGEGVTLDSDVLQRLTEPLLHLLRNAVDHGIEPPPERAVLKKAEEGVVRLAFERVGQEVRVVCQDDGRGLDLMTIFQKAVAYGLIEASTNLPDAEIARLILRAGFSTRDTVTEVSGRGVGLDVVAERLRTLKGRIDIEFEPSKGTRFVMHVPISAGSTHALVVRAEGELIALAADQVVVGLAAQQGQFSAEAGQEFSFSFDDKSYPGHSLSHWLGFDSGHADLAKLNTQAVVLARGSGGTVALAVDAIVESRELVLQELGSVLRRIPGVVAGSQRTDGLPLFLLDVPTLERAARSGGVQRGPNLALRKRLEVKRTQVLVADDALSVRKSMEQLLNDAGYEPILAVDGAQALERLREQRPAILLTDLEMPNMNGLELTRRVREVPDWEQIPVIMITSRASDKHRNLALETGVDVYLTKPYTDIDLLARVKDLISGGRKAQD